MFVIITTGLIFGTSAFLAALRAYRPRFRFGWLIATALVTAAWISGLLWLSALPQKVEIPLWHAATSANAFASFRVGAETWPLVFALLTLALSILLSAPSRPDFPNMGRWAVDLVIVGMGILATAAESPLTLVLFWAGLDLVDEAAALADTEIRRSSAGIGFAFVARLGSIALALLGLVLGDQGVVVPGLAGLVGSAGVLLPAAALMRLWAYAAPRSSGSSTRGLDDTETTLHLTGGAAAVAMLSRVETSAAPTSGVLLSLAAISAAYAAWLWLRAPSRRHAAPMWIMGLGSLAVASAVRASPLGAAGWGSAMVLAGSSLFLLSEQGAWLGRVILIGLWILSALPFSVSSSAWVGSAGPWDVLLVFLWVAQGFMLAGYAHWATRTERAVSIRPELAGLRGFYIAGILLPLFAGVVLGFLGWPGAMQLGAPVGAGVAVVLAGALYWAKTRIAALTPIAGEWFPARWQRAVSRLATGASYIPSVLRQVVEGFSGLIEGEAGILWSLLLLVIFVSLIAGGVR